MVGNTALELRRPDLALRFLDRGIAQDPRMAALREKRGLGLVMLQRPAEARAELEEVAVGYTPDDIAACTDMAYSVADDVKLDAFGA